MGNLGAHPRLGVDDPGDDSVEREGYCVPFNRRIALWDIGDLCVKYGLTRTQMRELAAVVILVTKTDFIYNHVRRAKCDLFQGTYRNFLKAYKRKREDGASFEEAMEDLVPRWQFQMMPNIRYVLNDKSPSNRRRCESRL